MTPTLPPSGGNGVLLVGEALGPDEARIGQPFVGPAGFLLTRLIRYAGLDRHEFGIINSAWCRPPYNRPPSLEETQFCRRAHWEDWLHAFRVVVPMGNVALRAVQGPGRGITETRGYVRPGPGTTHVVPTVHPSFIQRGQSKYAAAVINDLQKAATLARDGLPIELTTYSLDPSPFEALQWARAYRAALEHDPTTMLAYDIETPDVGDDEDERDEDRSYHIIRISFAYRPFEALSVPFTSEYMAAVHLLLGSEGVKVDWNGGFDRPRVRAAGVALNGPLYDGMVAWHVLHSDLPKRLGFVTTFTCPWQPEWKHLSHRQPAHYNATDSDVTLRSMLYIQEALKARGMWGVYERDVLALDVILRQMEQRGVLIDHPTRVDRVMQLAERRKVVDAELEALVPIEARRWEPKAGYVRDPAEITADMLRITVHVPVKRCVRCDMINPRKPHFRHLKTKVNPCDGAFVVTNEEPVERWAKLVPWKASRTSLIAYQHSLDRIVPHKYDKKTQNRKPSMDKKAIGLLMRKYPDDPFYSLILKQRELSKVAGTYLGYPVEDDDVAQLQS